RSRSAAQHASLMRMLARRHGQPGGVLECLCHRRQLHSFPTRRSSDLARDPRRNGPPRRGGGERRSRRDGAVGGAEGRAGVAGRRSEEHTSELQSRENLVCRLLLEKKNTQSNTTSKENSAGTRTCSRTR